MKNKLTASTILLLTIPPVLWAGNAVVGRIVRDWVPPMTLNLLRWAIALVILLPFARRAFAPGSRLWPAWRSLTWLGLLGVGLYNSLQYLALQTSTPINATLVAASMPVSMLLVGRLFFGARITSRQVWGVISSIAGVLIVLCRGDWHQLLALHLVPGDLYMIAATIAWSFYSWLLTRPSVPDEIRGHWPSFLAAQVAFGVLWSGAFAAGEWALAPHTIAWSWPLAAALLYIAIGPAIIAFGCWGAGVKRAGPTIGGFFTNLTPLFAALMSSAFLGEPPHLYHALAFALIVGGIVFSSRG